MLRGLTPGKPKNTAAEFVTGDHMPEEWRGSLLANDFRANRTVRYKIQSLLQHLLLNQQRFSIWPLTRVVPWVSTSVIAVKTH